MIKKAGYVLFAFFYHLFRVFPINKKKVFLVATHDDSSEGNIGIVAEALTKMDSEYQCVWFTRKDKITHPINFFLKKTYHLATSGTVFMDNGFLPAAYLHFPQNVKVVQLWHGTGTIKKFGQDVNTGELKKMEYRANQRITHLIVNSEEVKEEYASAFGVSLDKVYPLGLPRTDLILDAEYIEKKRQDFFRENPQLNGKRCILYAPTFRDEEVEKPDIPLDLERLSHDLAPGDVLLIRLHPFIAEHMKELWKGKHWDNIIDVSDYSGVTTLLAAADLLVTDYSSIVYEYCLLNRPMIFYAYDWKRFETTGRSFYRDYQQLVPGRIVTSQEDLLDALKTADILSIEHFVETMFDQVDGNAVKRLFELIFSF